MTNIHTKYMYQPGGNCWEKRSVNGTQTTVAQHSLPVPVYDAVRTYTTARHLSVEDSTFDLRTKWWILSLWENGGHLSGCRTKADLVKAATGKVSETHDEASTMLVFTRKGEMKTLVVKQVSLVCR